MPESDESLTHCRCGAVTEEDWEYCSRQCGVAAALLKLTAGDEPEAKVVEAGERATPPTLPFSALGERLDSDNEGLTMSVFLEMLRGMEPSSSRTAAERKEQTPGSADYLSLDGSLSPKGDLAFDRRFGGADLDTTQCSLPTGHDSNNFSLESSHDGTSSTPRTTHSPTTSISQVGFHTPLPRSNQLTENTAPFHVVQKFRRSCRRGRTLPQIQVHWYRDHSRFAPKESPPALHPRTPLTAPAICRNEISREELNDKHIVVGPAERKGIGLPHGFEENLHADPYCNQFQERSGGGSSFNHRSDTLKARVRSKSRSDKTSPRNPQAPHTDTNGKTTSVSQLAHCRTPTIGSSTSHIRTGLSSALKKFSDRLFSKIRRQFPKPPDVVFDIVSGSKDTPSLLFAESSSHSTINVLSAASPSDISQSPGMKSLIRSTSPDVPTSPTATRSSMDTSTAFLLTPYAYPGTEYMLTRRQVVSSSEHNEIENLALHATTRPDSLEHTFVEIIDGGPLLGPGQPVYLQLDNQEDTLVGPKHEDSEDDVWRDFIAIQCVRERLTPGHTIWT